jgi:hypothetical protein
VKPRISVLVPAMRGYESVAAALDAWETQTRRDALEILVLAPDRRGAGKLVPGQRIVETGPVPLHVMRAAGVRQAAADHLMFAEDHCLPDPDWTELMLPHLDGGWDVLGSALRSGDPSTARMQSSFLLGYGQWLSPPTGPAPILAGHNTIWRREVLVALEPRLEEELVVQAFLVKRARVEGRRFFLDGRASMRHFDPAGFGTGLIVLGSGGLGFGAIRTRGWNPAAKLAFLCAAPLIGAMHWRRGFREFLRARDSSGLSWSCLASAIPQALAWGFGESIGAIMGVARVTPYLWRAEIKPVTRERVAAAG